MFLGLSERPGAMMPSGLLSGGSSRAQEAIIEKAFTLILTIHVSDIAGTLRRTSPNDHSGLADTCRICQII